MRRSAPDDVWQRVIRLGCPVCFTGHDPLVREGLSAGIGVLVGVTLIVLACFACFFVVLARRARTAAAAEAAAGPETTRELPSGFGGVHGEAY